MIDKTATIKKIIMNEDPEIGSTYWTAYINHATKYTQILEAIWRGDRVDFLRQKEHRIFDSKKSAENWIKDHYV